MDEKREIQSSSESSLKEIEGKLRKFEECTRKTASFLDKKRPNLGLWFLDYIPYEVITQGQTSNYLKSLSEQELTEKFDDYWKNEEVWQELQDFYCYYSDLIFTLETHRTLMEGLEEAGEEYVKIVPASLNQLIDKVYAFSLSVIREVIDKFPAIPNSDGGYEEYVKKYSKNHDNEEDWGLSLAASMNIQMIYDVLPDKVKNSLNEKEKIAIANVEQFVKDCITVWKNSAGGKKKETTYATGRYSTSIVVGIIFGLIFGIGAGYLSYQIIGFSFITALVALGAGYIFCGVIGDLIIKGVATKIIKACFELGRGEKANKYSNTGSAFYDTFFYLAGKALLFVAKIWTVVVGFVISMIACIIAYPIDMAKCNKLRKSK